MKIATKISLSFFVTGIILTAVSVFAVYIVSKNNLKEQILHHLITAAESRANHIETFLKGNKELVQLLSYESVFTEILNINKNNSEYHKTFETVDSRLKHVIKNHKEFVTANLLNKNGFVVASSDKATVGYDKSDDKTFLNTKKAVYIGDIHISKTLGLHAIELAAPILLNDETLGIFIVALNVEALFNILEDRAGLYETGEIYLVNKDYYMISPSRFKRDVILKQKIDTVNARNCMKHTSIEHMRQSEMINVFKDYRGKSVLGTHVYIPEMNWGLLAEIDEKEAFVPLKQITWLLIFILIVVPLLAWLVGIFSSRVITGPIHKLHKGTEIIASGNLDHKIDIDAKDEIGQLSRAFDKMTVDLKGTTTSIYKLNKEIANRQRLEKDLRESDQKYRMIADNTTDVIWVLDAESQTFTYVSSSVERMLGFTDKECINKSVAQMVTPASLEYIQKTTPIRIERMLQGDTRFYIDEIEVIHKDGHIVQTEINMQFLKNRFTGRIEGTGVMRDITDRKRDQEELKKYRDHLEDMIEKRTADLIDAKKGAEDASRVKTEFLANVSHELRSPMNIITGMNYLLQQTDLTSKQKQHLNDTHQAAKDLQGLINNILDFSIIEQDQVIMEETRFDLNDLLANVLDQVKSKASRKELIFRIETDPDVPMILVGDPQKLSRALHHLIDNAIKVTEKGSVTIGVRCQESAVRSQASGIPEQAVSLLHSDQLPESSTRLRFEVVDTGIGIPQEQMDNLFQPLTQLDGSSTRIHGGIGLGLSVCKRLVELMGGEIGFESKPGRGSTFFFTAKFRCFPDIPQAVKQPEGERLDFLKTEKIPGGYRQEEFENMAPQLEELAGFLKVHDTRAKTVFAEVKEKLHVVLPAETDALGKKLDSFDFKGALEVLVTMTESLKIFLEKGDAT